ncbi:hypothetical protein O3P69_006014 [Scylla paramamosain]|uniref:Uncharacterized protein n=1 Tax=Scylla paramamosain TaxID=85552 RepID=A0AAW0U4F3_SCYPA
MLRQSCSRGGKENVVIMAAEGTSVAVVGYFKWTFAIFLYVITFIPSNYIYDEAKVVTVQRLLPCKKSLVMKVW